MEIKKLKQDIVVMTILMLLSASFYFIFIPNQIRLSSMFTGNTSFSSRTFPNSMAIAIFSVAGLGLVKALMGLVKHKKAKVPEGNLPESGRMDKNALIQHGIPYFVYILIVVYCILFEVIGYVFATLIVPPLLMYAIGCRKPRFYGYMYAFGVVLYLVFKVGLRIPMP